VAILLLTIPACVLDGEADLPAIEVSKAAMPIPGIPVGELGGDQSFSFTFTQPVGQLKLPSGVTPEVGEVATILSTGGATDLGFIHDLRVTVSGTGAAAGGLMPSEVAVYHSDGGSIGPTLIAPGGDTSQLLDHWKAQPLLFTVTFAGQLPVTTWSLDLAIRVRLRLKR
jgi:hypothetical protein